MLTNEQLINLLKANITTSLGGQASAQDVQAFIDLAVDQTAVLQQVRVESGIVKSLNIDAIDLGDPVMVKATEATAPDAADIVTPTIERATLTPVEVLAAFNVSFDFMRKNIEGQAVNESLNRIFAKRWGKDTVQVIFNGDTSNSGSTRTDKLLQCLDGFYVQAAADADVHAVDVAGADYLGTIFPNMLDSMPKDYKDDRTNLGLFVSPDVAEAYARQIGDRATALGDQVLQNTAFPNFRGIQVLPVFGNSDTKMVLTPKSNLAVGFGQQMEIGRDVYYRRRVVEVTIYGSLDAKYIVSDAFVYGRPA